VYFVIYSIIKFIYIIFSISVSLMTILHIFKTRYLEYYEKIKTIGCFKLEKDKIIVCVRYSTNPHTEYFEIVMSEDNLKIDIISNYRMDDLKHFTGVLI